MYLQDILQEFSEIRSHTTFLDGWGVAQQQGKFLEGWTIMAAHHISDFKVNAYDYFDKPLWNRNNKGRVILYLGGGFGDIIFGARWASEIAALGNEVIVCCRTEIMQVIAQAKGVASIIPDNKKPSIQYDYWLPGAFTIILMELDYNDMNGSPYLPLNKIENAEKIGLRWRGCPDNVQDKYRNFPTHLMFDAVKGKNCISLQRDAGVEFRPDWVEEVPLKNWEDTVKAISTCKVVISSCTSVAHLSGAMGVPTWILAPHTSHYWMYPDIVNNISIFYNSVTLFRNMPEFKYNKVAKKYEIIRNVSWQPLFKEIQKQL